MCEPTIVKHIRELEPTPDDWRQYADTGQACMTCTCGTTTGFVPIDQALTAFTEHGGQMPPQVKLDARGSDTEFADLIKRSPSV